MSCPGSPSPVWLCRLLHMVGISMTNHRGHQGTPMCLVFRQLLGTHLYSEHTHLCPKSQRPRCPTPSKLKLCEPRSIFAFFVSLVHWLAKWSISCRWLSPNVQNSSYHKLCIWIISGSKIPNSQKLRVYLCHQSHLHFESLWTLLESFLANLGWSLAYQNILQDIRFFWLMTRLSLE